APRVAPTAPTHLFGGPGLFCSPHASEPDAVKVARPFRRGAVAKGPRERNLAGRPRYCGFDVRLGSVSIALDAAHFRWHQAGGPEREGNGLALCVLHRMTFDLGAFTVSGGILLVSDQAHARTGFQETLMVHHGRPIREPQHPGWRPEPRHLDWHGREVF